MLRTNREAAFKNNKQETREHEEQQTSLNGISFIIVQLKVDDRWRRGVACTMTRDTDL